jgi:hypothetical protein
LRFQSAADGGGVTGVLDNPDLMRRTKDAGGGGRGVRAEE